MQPFKYRIVQSTWLHISLYPNWSNEGHIFLEEKCYKGVLNEFFEQSDFVGRPHKLSKQYCLEEIFFNSNSKSDFVTVANCNPSTIPSAAVESIVVTSVKSIIKVSLEVRAFFPIAKNTL